MSVTAAFYWEMLLGQTSPYGAYDVDAYDPDAFDTSVEWTDVTRDVRTTPAPTWSRGMYGGSPADRVAGVGMMALSMNNFPFGNPQKLGYYTPGHANMRDGFGLGIGCRLRAVYQELDEVLFFGTVESVKVAPGELGSRHVALTVVDWFEEAATNQVEGVSTMTDVRSDEVFEALVQSLPRQPIAMDVDEGRDTYAYAVDTARQEGSTAHSEIQKLAMSELGYCFLTADGTLVWESRSTRGMSGTENVYTFPAMHGLEVSRSRSEIVNKVRVIVHPRRIDAAPVVLYRTSQRILVGTGETLVHFGGYSDPDQRSQRIGAFDIQPMVAGTDYDATTNEDGTGFDVTSRVTVTAFSDGNGARFSVRNTGGFPAWTTLQLRGRGIYDFEHAIAEYADDDSIAQFGRRTLTIDMPYQSDVLLGASAAQFLVNTYTDDQSNVSSVSFFANNRPDFMRQALTREISDRIGLEETVTATTTSVPGSSAERGWFINGVRGEIQAGSVLRMTYILAPSDRGLYWRLGVAGATELGLTTRLSYGILG